MFDVEVIVIGEQVKKVDFHVPLMSLIHLTKDQWDEIPSVPNYLSAPLDVQMKWDARIGKNNDFSVGWSVAAIQDMLTMLREV